MDTVLLYLSLLVVSAGYGTFISRRVWDFISVQGLCYTRLERVVFSHLFNKIVEFCVFYINNMENEKVWIRTCICSGWTIRYHNTFLIWEHVERIFWPCYMF